MAYNLQSLITILQQILNPEQTRWVHFQNIPQLHSLLEKAESLQQILEKSSPSKTKKLDNQIRNAAHRAEDLIEPLMVDQMLSLPEGISFTLLAPDVEQVMQKLDYVMKQVVKLGEGDKMSSVSSSSGASLSSSKSVVVGVDEDLMQLKDRLTGMQSRLEIIPIVGMGGIGKTTLARNLYQDPDIVSHFKYLGWTTISQDYNMKAILSSLLRCIIGKEFDEEHIGKGSDELRDLLYRSLYGRKFMIVLDDIWSTKFWDEIRVYLPDNNNGSRIVITTRESDVVKYADSKSLEHQVQLLDQSKSWDLLRQIVFGEENCPDDVFQEIGEKIAGDCGGLPLAINVIGGILSKLERSEDVWYNIAKDVRAAIAKKDEQCSGILSLSYNHLSNHLRPCFLYMGAFPEDYEIKGSRLVRMWIGEGFVKANGDHKRSLEEEAENYLKALVERNLLLVKESKLNGKPKKRYSMHDLLRDLCISISSADNFLEVKHARKAITKSSNRRRVCFDASYSPHRAYDSTKMVPHVRSFLSTGRQILSHVFFAFRLLRVLHILEMAFEEFPTQVLQLVNLRYLAFDCNSSLPIGISRLCSLQTLIAFVESGEMPCEIWEMSELRHIKLNKNVQFEEEEEEEEEEKEEEEEDEEEEDMKKHVLINLQTLSTVEIFEDPIWNDFFDSFPNLKKLEIFILQGPGGSLDLSHLQKLEKLTCSFGCFGLMSTLRFPSSLKSLTLDTGSLCSRALSTLCDLPNLEALLIINCIFESEEERDEKMERDEDEEFSETEEKKYPKEWELAEDDEFRSLRFLHLDATLVQWRADETNFPRLRHLYIANCRTLEEIPSGIGEIPTLQLIEMLDCSASAVASAKQIQEVQQSDYANYDFQLLIRETEDTDSE